MIILESFQTITSILLTVLSLIGAILMCAMVPYVMNDEKRINSLNWLIKEFGVVAFKYVEDCVIKYKWIHMCYLIATILTSIVVISVNDRYNILIKLLAVIGLEVILLGIYFLFVVILTFFINVSFDVMTNTVKDRITGTILLIFAIQYTMILSFYLYRNYFLTYVLLLSSLLMIPVICIGIIKTISEPLKNAPTLNRNVAAIFLLLIWEIIIIINLAIFSVGLYSLNNASFISTSGQEIGILSLMYYTVITFTSVGMIDILPQTKISMILSIITALIGYIYSFGIAGILIATILGRKNVDGP